MEPALKRKRTVCDIKIVMIRDSQRRLACGGVPQALKEAKPLPFSD